jgi:PAS domain S-box-containing protein
VDRVDASHNHALLELDGSVVRATPEAPASGERVGPAARVLLCALSDAFAIASMQALSEGRHALLSAPDVSQALGLMTTDSPAIVMIGGTSTEAVAHSCEQLRAAATDCGAVMVAVVREPPRDVSPLLDAGADDILVDALDDDALRSRLRVADRSATRIAYHRATEHEREPLLRLSLQLQCVAGLDGYLRTVNSAWTKTLGWSSLELLWKPWLDIIHPDDRAEMAAAIDELRSHEPRVDFTNRCRSTDGSYRWLEWRAALEREAIYAVATDVTATRATREALRRSSEALSTMLDSIGDGVIATDRSGAIDRMNPVAERLTEWTFAEAHGKPILDVLPLLSGETRGKVDDPLHRAIREGVVGQLPKHTLLVRRDGTEIPIADSCAPIRAGDGTVDGAIMVIRGLTAQHDAEAVQANVQKQLVFADRMAAVGTLAAGVAHEINNPLSFVVANIDLAIEEVRSIGGGSSSGQMKELEEMLREARAGAARVTKIVRGLKTFSRSEEERPGVIDIVHVIKLSVSMALNEIRHRASLVEDFGKVPYVEADEARLGHVFINLLVNAAQAFKDVNTDTNEIRVSTSTDAEGRAVVEVRDNGSGIPPALLSRVFGPFFTTKPIGVGTGLGLAISHGIVTQMGGSMSVESELRGGTTFRVVLPPAASTELRTTAVNGQSAGLGRPGTVLVVDDEPAVGPVIRRVLAHHHVTVVATAKAALDLFAAGQNFDVVLCDLMMPCMSGMDLYRELARLYPETALRVVFLTGGAFPPEGNAFLDRVANERMDKPFDTDKLRELISKFVRRESMRAPGPVAIPRDQHATPTI